MITIYNKSNRPIGIAGLSVLPSKEIKVKDRDAYCTVFDEYGKDTGKREILPGLKALEQVGFITIRVDAEAEQTKAEEPVETAEAVEETAEVAAEKPKRKYTRKVAEKTEE